MEEEGTILWDWHHRPHFREKKGLEGLRNLPKFTQIVNRASRIQIQASYQSGLSRGLLSVPTSSQNQDSHIGCSSVFPMSLLGCRFFFSHYPNTEVLKNRIFILDLDCSFPSYSETQRFWFNKYWLGHRTLHFSYSYEMGAHAEVCKATKSGHHNLQQIMSLFSLLPS